ncbi:LLM class flavin-dependent oxidoreductase [Nocardia sp. CC201C]|uniref:LLM class flavin-dependent oxidoreductase n=1 Tax=Nocardia sp. CC201C TaxID=3044575 RepID=UPI0024A9FB61|nr:LLM class flavin-dependent oxidoreductase [Nocardia sp. CC201C]
MTGWVVHHDLRAPEFGTPAAQLYRAALDISQWADEQGAASIILSEHHGSSDGYLPSPLTMAAAMAARTRRATVTVAALNLTLRDPIATAEDAIVVDLISGGRLVLVLAGGYVPHECDMFGIDFGQRASIFEEKLAVFVEALRGTPFDYQGRTVTVTPKPVSRPRPPVLLGGLAAKRAARFADGFMPALADSALAETYSAECARLGKGSGFLSWPGGPKWIFVTEDPEKSWAQIGAHVLHDFNAYGRWEAAAPGAPAFSPAVDVATVRELGNFAVVTPEECVDLARELGPDAKLVFKPLIAGLDPEIGWASMELFVRRVLPVLQNVQVDIAAATVRR